MDPYRKRLIIGAAIAAALVLLFLAGYVPGHRRARRAMEESRQTAQRLGQAQSELTQTQFDLQTARLRGQLGEVLYDANASNFGYAASRATAFFDGVRALLNSSHLAAAPDRRKILEAVLARRDEISADLARADQGVRAKLAELYMQFGQAVP